MILAVDIVLIPLNPEILLNLSNQLCTEDFRLSDSAFPHLSLAMVAVNHSSLNELQEELSTWKDLTVDCGKLQTVKSSTSTNVLLQIVSSSVLLELHQRAMSLISHFRAHGADGSAFAGPISRGTWEYFSNFELYAHDRFEPHITLGEVKGDIVEMEIPKQLQLRPALFQLGNRCTCAVRLC